MVTLAPPPACTEKPLQASCAFFPQLCNVWVEWKSLLQLELCSRICSVLCSLLCFLPCSLLYSLLCSLLCWLLCSPLCWLGIAGAPSAAGQGWELSVVWESRAILAITIHSSRIFLDVMKPVRYRGFKLTKHSFSTERKTRSIYIQLWASLRYQKVAEDLPHWENETFPKWLIIDQMRDCW